MLVAHVPRPSVYQHSNPSMPYFKRQRTGSGPSISSLAESQSPSPEASLYGSGLPPRGTSPTASTYSHSSSSSPSVASVSSFNSTKNFPKKPLPPLTPSWLTRAPRTIPLSSINIMPADAVPDTPIDVPEAELRRRQLDKATRILGETLPIELVFQPHRPIMKSFPDPPVRRSTDGPQPEKRPRETTGRRNKLTRRASLTLSVFTSRFRTGSSAHHSPNPSQDFQLSSPESSSPSSPPASFPLHIPHRHPSLASISPITFAFPRKHTPSRPAMPGTSAHTSDPAPVIDIRSAAPSPAQEDDSDEEEEEEATPVREHPSLARAHGHSYSEILPRSAPMSAQMHTHAPSEQFYSRPDTPFADYRPTTPFLPEPALFDAFNPVSRKERGQGWSGEWNQSDMRDVIHKLRTLK